MTCNSLIVLGDIVRSGLWSKQDSLSRFRTVILDVESVIEYLYKRIAHKHISNANPVSNKPDLYASTLISYIDFTQDLKRLFDYFAILGNEVLLVYKGDFMEAPLFDLLAAEFTKNTQRVVESIGALVDYQKRGPYNLALDHFLRPNLLLIAFKSYVNERRATGAAIRVYQAYYHSYPLLAKLARDMSCPVLTNNGDFIIMDVRAGFVLMDQFWSQIHDKRGPISATGTKNSTSVLKHQKNTFHYNSLFLKQHPGLSAPVTINMFPLTTVDFVIKYSKSLEYLKIFTTKYSERDFLKAPGVDKKVIYHRYQSAANRLERVLTFLSGKTINTFGNMVRSESVRSKSRFDEDYRQLFNYYAVAYEFKTRLRFILKFMRSNHELIYIEKALTDRECTAHYLMSLLCCSVGELASVNYNHYIQFEDLSTNLSAFSMMNHQKSMLMSLLAGSGSSLKTTSPGAANEKRNSPISSLNTSLTLIDRKLNEVTNYTVEVDHSHQLEINLSKLVKGEVSREKKVQFMNLAFKCKDLLHLSDKMRSTFQKYGKERESNQLALMLSLFDHSFKTASKSDEGFRRSYAKLEKPFQLGLQEHFNYYHLINTNEKDVVSLVNYVKKHNATSLSTISSPMSKQVRHLIELLCASMEGYSELNAFMGYPLPKLDLNHHFNPILLFNLTVHKLEGVK